MATPIDENDPPGAGEIDPLGRPLAWRTLFDRLPRDFLHTTISLADLRYIQEAREDALALINEGRAPGPFEGTTASLKGIDLYVRTVAGDPSAAEPFPGEPTPLPGDIIVLGGLTGSAKLLKNFAAHLNLRMPGRTVHFFDAPGVGESGPVSGYSGKLPQQSIRQSAELAGEFLSQLDHPAIVYGISHGSAVALQTAALYPEQVSRLILQDPAGLAPFGIRENGTLRRCAALLGGFADSRLGDEFFKAWLRTRALLPDRLPGRYFTPDHAEHNAALRARLLAIPEQREAQRKRLAELMRFQPEVPDLLRQVDQPTLIIGGMGDYLNPVSSSRWLASQLKNGMLRLLPRVRHNTHFKHPDIIAEHARASLSDGEGQIDFSEETEIDWDGPREYSRQTRLQRSGAWLISRAADLVGRNTTDAGRELRTLSREISQASTSSELDAWMPSLLDAAINARGTRIADLLRLAVNYCNKQLESNARHHKGRHRRGHTPSPSPSRAILW